MSNPALSTGSVPVDLVTGFLGSGKTTLINAVLNDRAFAGTLVVVNEFGDVGLDHLLVSSAQDNVVLLPSGCLCCAASGTLRDTLIDLFARRSGNHIPPFTRVIVETSGLARPGPLLATLLGDSALRPRCHLTGVLTLVDAVHGAITIRAHEEARQQVALADHLLVTKAQLAAPDGLAALLEHLQLLNPNAPARILRWGDTAAYPFRDARAARTSPAFVPALSGAGSMGRGPWSPGMQHGPEYRSIASFTLALPQFWAWDAYSQLTQQLSQRLGRRLLRCKGLMALGDPARPSVIQGVQGYFAAPQRLPDWPEGVPRGFLVCITQAVAKDELQALVQPFVDTGEMLPT